MAKLLVTGGAGFIGSAFVRQAVKRGYDVGVVDVLTYAGDIARLKEVDGAYRLYRIDITDGSLLNEAFSSIKPDIVVHFAAETHVDRSILSPNSFIMTNVVGTLNLLELSRKHKVERFLNISTDEVYGELGEKGKFSEESPFNPNSPYSVSKASADMLARAYNRTYGLPVTVIRPSNNYGAWQYPEKLIPVVIVKALRGEPIPVYGQGLNIREWLFVEDCAEAILQVIEKGKNQDVYNVGSGVEVRNIDVVKAILKILGKPESLITFVKDRPGHDFRYSLDTTKINRTIGWSPKTKFEDGLKFTVDWYVENFDWVEEKIKFLQDYWKKVYNGV